LLIKLRELTIFNFILDIKLRSLYTKFYNNMYNLAYIYFQKRFAAQFVTRNIELKSIRETKRLVSLGGFEL